MPSWVERINAAVQRKSRGFPGFTADDVQDSQAWRSCAVDEALRVAGGDPRGLTPLELNSRPVDDTLADLGTRFAIEVSKDQPRKAMLTYDRIRLRVAELEKLGRS